MEAILANKILEMSTDELVKLLRELRLEDREVYEKLSEKIEDAF